MKFCPKCNAQYGYEMSFCLEDGTPLQVRSSGEAEKPSIISQNSLENASEETVSFSPPPHSLPLRKSEAQKSQSRFPLGLITAAILLTGAATCAIIYFQNASSKDVAAGNRFTGNTANPVQAGNSNEDANVTVFQNSSNDSGNDKQNSPSLEKTNSGVNIAAKKTPDTAVATNTQTVETGNTEFVKTSAPTPSPVKPSPPPGVSTSVSGGIPNRKTISLVRAIYPPAAVAARASGKVDVQITIDENGGVVAAYAVSGHPALRLASEQAARASKFSPAATKGSATGTLVYTFTPSQ